MPHQVSAVIDKVTQLYLSLNFCRFVALIWLETKQIFRESFQFQQQIVWKTFQPCLVLPFTLSTGWSLLVNFHWFCSRLVYLWHDHLVFVSLCQLQSRCFWLFSLPSRILIAAHFSLPNKLFICALPSAPGFARILLLFYRSRAVDVVSSRLNGSSSSSIGGDGRHMCLLSPLRNTLARMGWCERERGRPRLAFAQQLTRASQSSRTCTSLHRYLGSDEQRVRTRTQVLSFFALPPFSRFFSSIFLQALFWISCLNEGEPWKLELPGSDLKFLHRSMIVNVVVVVVVVVVVNVVENLTTKLCNDEFPSNKTSQSWRKCRLISRPKIAAAVILADTRKKRLAKFSS